MSRLAARLATLALPVLSLGAVALAAEGVFRTWPQLLPVGAYGSGRFDPELGLTVHGGDTIYNKVRFVRKHPNARGFMDVDHAEAKPAGVFRVAFFGDSYVEASQVPTEQAFFRLLPDRLPGRVVEPLAFGMSGWGTLHAFLAWQKEAPRYDVDLAIYVFVENDPGDNSVALAGGRRRTPTPYADLSPAAPGYRVVWSPLREEPSLELRLMKALQNHSLVAQLAITRIQLLRQRGVQAAADARQKEMAGYPSGVRVAQVDDPPGQWPPADRAAIGRLGASILGDWKRRSDETGRALWVLYVPRGEAQLRGELAEADTWLPWLRASCASLGLRFVDPSSALRAASVHAPVYDDHFSPAGHEVIADLLARAIEPELPGGGS